MQKDSKLFEDFARMASAATGTLFDVKREIEAAVAAQMEKFLSRMNFVSRDEFETLRQQVLKLQQELESKK